MSWDFLLTAFIVCAAPGIGVVFTLSTTFGGGARAGVIAALGCTLATGVHLLVALAGLAAVLHTSALLFQTVKYAGVAYLLWMAWAMLQGQGGLEVAASAPASAGRILRRAVLVNLLNPKLPLFFVAFLPQFMPEGAGPAAMAALGAGFSAMTFATFLLYVALAASGRRRALRSARLMGWLRNAFAASFAALGLRLALERAT